MCDILPVMCDTSLPHILLIVSDTVRRDMLGYNGGSVQTPNLDRLAECSMVFDRYYVSSFPTVPARYDFLTGKPAFAGPGWGPSRGRIAPWRSTWLKPVTRRVGVVDTPFYQVNGYQYDRGFNYFYDMKSQLLGTPHYSSFKAAGENKHQGNGKLPQWPITGKVEPDPRTGEMDCPAPVTMAQAENAWSTSTRTTSSRWSTRGIRTSRGTRRSTTPADIFPTMPASASTRPTATTGRPE